MILLFSIPALVLLAFLARQNYHAALMLLVSLLPTYLLRFSVAGLTTNFFEAALAVVLLTGLTQPAIRHTYTLARHQVPRSLRILLTLFILAAIISTLISPHQRTSLGILKGWIIVPVLFGAALTAALQHAPALRRRVINALLLSGTIMATLGLMQVPLLDRVRGIYDVPASLALFLTPLATIAWWRGNKLAALTMVAALLATQSASALVALFATLMIGLLAWPRASRRQLAALVLLIFLALTVLSLTGRGQYLLSPLFSDTPNSISVRGQLWSVAAELITEHPFLGIGLGQFEPAYQEKLHDRFAVYSLLSIPPAGGTPPQAVAHYSLQTPLPEFVYRDPHNWILSFWLNTGLLGLVSFIVLNAVIVKRAYPAHDKTTQALLVALLSIFIHGLVETIFWKNDLSALHFVLLALLAAQPRPKRKSQPGSLRQ